MLSGNIGKPNCISYPRLATDKVCYAGLDVLPGTTRPFRSHAERRTWSEDFINGWIRSNGKPAEPATIAQQYLRRQQDWFDKPRQLTTEEVLGLLDASPLVEPWNFNTEEHGGVTFTDLSSLKRDAILK